MKIRERSSFWAINTLVQKTLNDATKVQSLKDKRTRKRKLQEYLLYLKRQKTNQSWWWPQCTHFGIMAFAIEEPYAKKETLLKKKQINEKPTERFIDG
jgi:hypothetical protein